MKKKIIWIVVAVLIIIAALMGILYYTTDLFKTPEQLFYRHFAESSNMLGKTEYEDVMKELKKQSEKKVELAGEVTAKITSNDNAIKEVAKVLEKGKITYNMKSVGSEKKMQNDITLNYDGKDIVTLNVLKNKEQYGIKIAEAYEKYVSVENNNLKDLFKKLGVDTTDVPNKFESVDYYELLNIEKETLDHIKKTYGDVIKKNISPESYVVEKDVSVKIDGEDVKTNAYKLTLTEEQLRDISVNILEILKSDDKTLDLIINKYNKIIEPYKTMGTSASVADLNKEEFVKSIENLIEELKKSTVEKQDALQIIIYGAQNNKARMEVSVISNNETVMEIQTNMSKAGSEKKSVTTMTVEDVVMEIQTAYDDNKIDVEVNCKSEEDKVQLVMSSDKEKTDVVIAVDSDGTKIEIFVKQEQKDSKDVVVEDFTADNSVKLNDMTQAEMQTLVQTIYTNVMSVLPQKMQLLGINMGQLQ